MPADDFYNESFIHYDKKFTADSLDEPNRENTPIIAQDVPCRAERRGSAQSLRNGALELVTTHTVFTDYADLDQDDLIHLEARNIDLRVIGIQLREASDYTDAFWAITGEEVKL